MKRLRAWIVRLAGLVPSARRERDHIDELNAHLQMHMEDNVRAGMSLGEARRDALTRLGGMESARQAYRDRATLPVFENLLKDLRFTARQLRRGPAFTATAILMIALGLCASVSIFAFVDAALLKPLPYRDPNRLVAVYEAVPMFEHSNLSYPDYLDWKKMNEVFAGFDAYGGRGYSLSTPSGVTPATGARVTDGFLKTLGVSPVLGRGFYPGEDLPSAPHTVLLSFAEWQQRYGGRADVIGKTVRLNEIPHVIIGVLPEDFHFAPVGAAQYWTTIHAASECDLRRSCHSLYGVARLRDGVSIETARANVVSIARQLERQYPADNRDQGASLLPLAEAIHGEVREILLVLLGGAVLLLAIAAVNVTGLLLVRSESRKREISVRIAMGASRARLLRQFAAEGVLLAAIGGAAGLGLAHWTVQILLKLIPSWLLDRMPFLMGLALNSRVLLFAGTVVLLAAALFSFTPAVHLFSAETREGLAEGSRGSAGNTWRRLGSKLVVVELATAIVLLVGAGLLGKSLYRLLQVDTGLRPDHLATLLVAAPEASYPKNEQGIALAREISEKVRALPGVESVAVTSDLPIHGWGDTTWVRILGRPWHGEHDEMPERDVSANYFSTIGAKLIRGRYFREGEDLTKPRVAIINEAYAKHYFPSEDPIGKQLSFLTTPPVPIEIVGIVADIKEGQVGSRNQPALYLPFDQAGGTSFNLAVRTAQAPEFLFPSLAAVIRRINPEILTAHEATMDSLISDSTYLPRSSAWLVGGFAAIALLLSIAGLYGVVAYSVSRRTREIGVRMALGANPGAVYRLILREAGWLTALGIAAGLLLSVGAGRFMQGMLYVGTRSWDAPTLAGVAIVLGACALLASFLPARRAALVNPVDALRAE
jgi:predicted permease